MTSSLLILIWPLGSLSCASCLWCRNLTYAGCHRSPAIRANSRIIVSRPDQRALDFQGQNFPYPRSYFSIAHTPALSGLSPGFLPLGSMDCVANSNLFISPDAKGHDNVSSLGNTGVWLVCCSSTLAAWVSLALPPAPYTQIWGGQSCLLSGQRMPWS